MDLITGNEFIGNYKNVEKMTVIEINQNWITFIYDGHWVQAKVYSEPSSFGVDDSRISKLCIAPGRDFKGLDEAIYNYDRGLDFDNTTSDIVKEILLIFPN